MRPAPNDPHLGILSLDTGFERVIGDAGNPDSYPFPARVAVVPGAGSPDIVRDGPPPPGMADGFVAAARNLVDEGAVALVSTCGFLVHVQADIAGAVDVPVLLSALSLGPAILDMTGGPLGILTASEAALGPETLAAARLNRTEVRIAGMQACPAFRAAYLPAKAEQASQVDIAAIREGAVTEATRLVTADPDIRAILLECGNLPPHADAIRSATGRPVFHLLQGAAMLWASTKG